MKNNDSINIDRALTIAWDYSQIDGSHHKAWVIDQMVRKIIGNEEKYNKFIKDFCDGEDGEYTYEWDVGIAP